MTWLLLGAAIFYDWRRTGRAHPVYLIGGAAMVVLHLTQVQVAESPAWQAAAAAIGRITG